MRKNNTNLKNVGNVGNVRNSKKIVLFGKSKDTKFIPNKNKLFQF